MQLREARIGVEAQRGVVRPVLLSLVRSGKLKWNLKGPLGRVLPSLRSLFSGSMLVFRSVDSDFVPLTWARALLFPDLGCRVEFLRAAPPGRKSSGAGQEAFLPKLQFHHPNHGPEVWALNLESLYKPEYTHTLYIYIYMYVHD